MKPLNLDNRPCSPISSNCVIWQGPDIPCINLCTGDSVSDVVYKLATELCTVMDTLKVTNYDLSCFNLAACPPTDFQALIQFLITQICELQGLTPGTDGTKSTCPDCVITVAPCFVTNGQTTMQLIDYIQMIANKICTIIDEISVINNQISNLDARVTVLENTPPPTFTLPTIDTGCLVSYIPGTPASETIDIVLDTLLNNNTIGYCSLIDATGLPADLLSAVARQCIDGASDSLANPGTPMGTEYFGTWINTPVTVADAITNLWIALCDARLGIEESSVVVVEAGLGTEVTSATVGLTTTYTVSTLGVMLASQAPVPNINKLTPSWGGGRLCDGDLIIMSNEVYDEDAAYNPATGIWTCPTSGLYRLDFVISLTAPSPDGWLDQPSQLGGVPYTYSANSGMIIAGLVSSTACDYYTVNNFTPTVITKHATISGSVTTIISAGNTVCLKIANLTNLDYTSTSGDSVKMAIQRIR